jgi:hypothetical protein
MSYSLPIHGEKGPFKPSNTEDHVSIISVAGVGETHVLYISADWSSSHLLLLKIPTSFGELLG